MELFAGIIMHTIKNFINNNYHLFLETLKQITLTPSPPFQEEKRIFFLQELTTELGYESEIDPEGNLMINIKGNSDEHVIYSAHADTVFSEDTPLKIIEHEDTLLCPGICDNSLGNTALLYLMKFIKENNLSLKQNTTFLFNVGEEGLGNLRGIKYYFDHLNQQKVKAHIVIEGHELGRLTTTTVGSHRRRIKITTQGGHSWRDYGKANAIILAAQIIGDISQLEYPTEPKTTYNIGTIRGGDTINSIAQQAEFTFEIRFLEQDTGKNIIEKLNQLLQSYNNDEVAIQSETLGDRPCGAMTDQKLINLVKEIHQQLQITTLDDIGSTDSNYPISLGLPSLTIGISDACKTHSLNECLMIKPIEKGLRQLLIIFEKLNT